MVAMQGYTETVEELDEETMAARIAILLEAWGTEVVADLDRAEVDDATLSRYDWDRQRAFELASQFPSQITDNLFAEYVEEGLVA